MKATLAFVAAGVVAVLTRTALQLTPLGATQGATAPEDPRGIRFVTGLAFFVVLIILGRWAFQDESTGRRGASVDKTSFRPPATPQDTAGDMARIFSGVTDDTSGRRAIGEWLHGIPRCSVLIPLIFYLGFGTVGPLGWGLTVFFDVYCLLWAIGLYFLPRTEYHSRVEARGDWADRVGAFWLVGCAFGPFFGWLVTEALPITPGSWSWLYGARVALAAVIPIVLALPLMRYMRGKAALVGLPLLVGITLLAVSTAMPVGLDLWEGPTVRQAQARGGWELYLTHTERSLEEAP